MTLIGSFLGRGGGGGGFDSNAAQLAIQRHEVVALGKLGRGDAIRIFAKGTSRTLGSPGTTTAATDAWPVVMDAIIQLAYRQSISTTNVTMLNLGVGGSDIIEDDQIAALAASIATEGVTPDVLLYSYGINDLNDGITNTTTSGQEAIDRFYNRMVAAGQDAAARGIAFYIIEEPYFPNTGQDSVTVNDRYDNKWLWAFNEAGRLASLALNCGYIRTTDDYEGFLSVGRNTGWKLDTVFTPETDFVHDSTIGAAMLAGIIAKGFLPSNLWHDLKAGVPQYLLWSSPKAKYPLDEGTRNSFAGYDSAFYPVVASVTGSDDSTVNRLLVDHLVWNPCASAALYQQVIDNSGSGVGAAQPQVVVTSYNNTPVTTVFSGPVPGSGAATGAGGRNEFIVNLPYGWSNIRLILSSNAAHDFKGGNFLVEPGVQAGRGTFVTASGTVSSATATTAVLPSGPDYSRVAVGQSFRIVSGTTVQQAAITAWDAGTRTATVVSWPGGTPTASSVFVISQITHNTGTMAGATNEEFYWVNVNGVGTLTVDCLYGTTASTTGYDIPFPVGMPAPLMFPHNNANGAVIQRSAVARPGTTASNNAVSTQASAYLRRDTAVPTGYMWRIVQTASNGGHFAHTLAYTTAK